MGEDDGSRRWVVAIEGFGVIAENDSFARDRGQNRGGVSGLIITCFPERLAGLSLVGKENGAFRIASSDDDFVLEYEGRGADSPLDVGQFIFGEDGALPDGFSGGGIKAGGVIGATDKIGAAVTDRPVTPPDMAATILSVLGIDPDTVLHTPLGRPVPLALGGKPVTELI